MKESGITTSVIAIIIVAVIIVAGVSAYVVTRPEELPPGEEEEEEEEEVQLKVASLYPSPAVTSSTWDLSQHEAMVRVTDKYNCVYEFTEGISGGDAELVGRSYAERGFDIIVFSSSWYPDAVKGIVRDYPDIYVIATGSGAEINLLYPPGEEVPPNYGHHDSLLHESAYLAGYLAGKITKTNILGAVGGYPVANTNMYFNGFIQGAKDANSGVEIKLVYIYTWYDPLKGKEAAIALAEDGADIICHDATGAGSGAEEAGAWTIPLQLDQPDRDVSPDFTIASSNWTPDPVYDAVISSVIEGRIVGREYYFGMPEGESEFKVHLPEEVPSDVISEINELERRIISRELVIIGNIANPEQYWGL